MSAITSPSFQKLVLALKKHKKTLTVVEQACGGLINTSIMAQPGASQVYLGGCIPYNTSKTKGLLLNNTDLHQSLTTAIDAEFDKSTSSGYINSKCNWTRKTATAFCTELQSDYAISEGGAAGPTFNPVGMKSGFTVISIAGRKRNEDDNGDIVKLLKQDIIKASTNKRQKNMRLFADAAAELLLEILNDEEKQAKKKKEEEELLIKISNYDEKQDKKEKKKKEEEELPITLDRCTVLRSDDKALYYIERIAKYIVVNKTDMLFKKSSDNDGSVPELALISYEDIMNEYYTSTTNNITKTFLGRLSDKSNTPIFSIDILPDDETDYLVDLGRFLHNTDGYYMSNVRTTAPLLNQLHNELALHAMAYSNWQRKNKYCTNCGSSVPLDLIHGSTCQKCSSCQSMYWPRQDPSMIASIISRCGNKILLARSHRHPPKMHTVLAGFVEVGCVNNK
jgi:NADH pyrophosphatase NudC (nudix superfamily)/nicotinamide mononucleotide (NMN) deamidase PncC